MKSLGKSKIELGIFERRCHASDKNRFGFSYIDKTSTCSEHTTHFTSHALASKKEAWRSVDEIAMAVSWRPNCGGEWNFLLLLLCLFPFTCARACTQQSCWWLKMMLWERDFNARSHSIAASSFSPKLNIDSFHHRAPLKSLRKKIIQTIWNVCSLRFPVFFLSLSRPLTHLADLSDICSTHLSTVDMTERERERMRPKSRIDKKTHWGSDRDGTRTFQNAGHYHFSYVTLLLLARHGRRRRERLFDEDEKEGSSKKMFYFWKGREKRAKWLVAMAELIRLNLTKKTKQLHNNEDEWDKNNFYYLIWLLLRLWRLIVVQLGWVTTQLVIWRDFNEVQKSRWVCHLE